MLLCVAVSRNYKQFSLLQYVAVCCTVLQCVAVSCRVMRKEVVPMIKDSECSVVQYGAVCCSVLQYVAVCCSVLQCVADLQYIYISNALNNISILQCLPCVVSLIYRYGL